MEGFPPQKQLYIYNMENFNNKLKPSLRARIQNATSSPDFVGQPPIRQKIDVREEYKAELEQAWALASARRFQNHFNRWSPEITMAKAAVEPIAEIEQLSSLERNANWLDKQFRCFEIQTILVKQATIERFVIGVTSKAIENLQFKEVVQKRVMREKLMEEPNLEYLFAYAANFVENNLSDIEFDARVLHASGRLAPYGKQADSVFVVLKNGLNLAGVKFDIVPIVKRLSKYRRNSGEEILKLAVMLSKLQRDVGSNIFESIVRNLLPRLESWHIRVLTNVGAARWARCATCQKHAPGNVDALYMLRQLDSYVVSQLLAREDLSRCTGIEFREKVRNFLFHDQFFPWSRFHWPLMNDW